MEYKDVNDYEVVYMIHDNDDDAIEILVNKYKPLIEKKIKKWGFILKKRDLYLDDIRQELNLCIVNAAKNFNEDCNTLLYTYINKTLDGYLMNYFKKYLKEENVFSLDEQVDGDKSFIIDLIPDSDNDPSQKIDVSERLNFLNDFSMSLPMDQSVMFEMYVEGYKIKEISTIVDKTEGSVRTSLSRILNKLRKEIDKN